MRHASEEVTTMAEDLGFRFTWYGHSCVEIESEAGTRVLFDPWFGNPRSPASADSVERCDVLLVTHGHHDHLGAMPGQIDSADALAIARRTAPAWPAIHELSLWLERFETGAEVIGMNKGGTIETHGVRVTMVHADHSAGDVDAGTGLPIYLGEAAGFVVELENGVTVYHAGDTAVFGDLRIIGEGHRPDVAFLPIGGHYTMGPASAARAIELLGVSTVVPIHYGTFPILAGSPEHLNEELRRLDFGDVRVIAPEPGEPVS
jgi:L-ascorbate metabolism protein UlaG (beta-lactamase superfamily)